MPAIPLPASVRALLALPGLDTAAPIPQALARLHAAIGDGHTGSDLAPLATAVGASPAALATALTAGGWAGSAEHRRPLVLDAGWLAPRRAWMQEKRLVEALRQRCAQGHLPVIQRDPGVAEDLLALFPDNAFARSVDGVDWQRLATATALSRGCALITGGPGTGKTTVAGRFLIALARHHERRHLPDPVVILTAPTGKAAARLREAVEEAARPEVARGRISSDRATALAATAITLHRWLRHPDPERIDVMILDEASMADTATLDAAIQRLPATARLVILGDPDQLAAVAPGRALADLASLTARSGTGSTRGLATWYQGFCSDPVPIVEGSPVATAQVRLRATWRSKDAPRLAALAEALRQGDWLEPEANDTAIARQDLPAPTALVSRLLDHDGERIRAVLTAPDAAAALAQLGGFRWLCALRHGPYGCEALARILDQELARRGWIERDADGHYHGRPLLITANRPDLGLANGDIGVVWNGEAVFNDSDGVRPIPLHRLGTVAPAWILTVHQSQGSQFTSVEVITAPQDSPVLTRELLYTAITRARHRVRVWGDRALLALTATRSSTRRGRLVALLTDG